MENDEKDMNSNAISVIGKRIERLLFFGMLLLALSFFELYLVDATIFFEKNHVPGLSTLITNLQNNHDHMVRLFEKQNHPNQVVPKTDREIRVAKMRSLLGLPPATQVNDKDDPETYKVTLTRMVRSAESDAKAAAGSLESIVDDTISPDQLIAKLIEKQRAVDAAKSTIWGIEVPQSIALSYFGGDFKIPARFLAISMIIVLVPLIVGWLGSLYITREQELACIEKVTEFGLKFPHILNLFFVEHSGLIERLPSLKATPQSRRVNRILLAIFRSVVILVFAAPMVGIFSNSALSLASNIDLPSWLYWVAIIATAVMSMQTLVLVVQEWMLPYGKEFSN